MKRLRRIAEELGPDDVVLKKPINGYPAGTECTVMDIDYNGKLTLQVNSDGHEIITTKSNIKRRDGQKFELIGNLNKIANDEDDEMSFDEIKDETIDAINEMEKHVNEWAIRDQLLQFTNWGFYKGESMVSIDENIAQDICDQLLKYVNNLHESNIEQLCEVNDIVGRYARY